MLEIVLGFYHYFLYNYQSFIFKQYDFFYFLQNCQSFISKQYDLFSNNVIYGLTDADNNFL
jgi:hypothetical protein